MKCYRTLTLHLPSLLLCSSFIPSGYHFPQGRKNQGSYISLLVKLGRCLYVNHGTAHELYFLNSNTGNLVTGYPHPNQIKCGKVEQFIKSMVYPKPLPSRSAPHTRDFCYTRLKMKQAYLLCHQPFFFLFPF